MIRSELRDYDVSVFALAIGLLWAGVCAQAGAKDWPQFRGPGYRAVSTESEWRGVWEEPPPIWEVRVHKGCSSVAVVDGLVYTQGVPRLRSEERKALREQFPGLNPTGREYLFCLDAATGEERWRTQLDVNRFVRGSLATPAVKNGRVFAFGPNGKLTSCDSRTGEILWQRNLMKELSCLGAREGLASSPVVHDGKVMLHLRLPTEDHDPALGWKQPSLMHCFAFDTATGKEIWRSKSYEPVGQGGHGDGTWSSPAFMELDGNPTLVCYIGNAVVGLNPKDGSERWHCDLKKLFPDVGGHQYSSFWPLQVGDDSFTSQIWNDRPDQNDQSRACLLRVVDGQPELAWENQDLAVQLSNYTVWNGYIYAMDTSMAENSRRKRQELGQLQCLDVETGELIWHTSDFYDPTIGRKFNRKDCDNAPTWLIVDGKIIIWDRVQIIIGDVSPEGYKRLAAFPLGDGRPGKTWTAMAFSNGRLFVRSGSTLYGIDLRKERDGD